MRGPLAALANGKISIETALTAAEDALTIPPNNRVISIASPEDGGVLSYTLYKVAAGKIDKANEDSTIYLYKTEANDPATPTVWENMALLEGSLVVDRGSFNTYDSIKSINLTKNPIIEGSVSVFINAPESVNASGVYTQVESIYFASGATDKIFQINLNDASNVDD